MIIQDDLKQLVSQSVKLLGKALREIHGDKIYHEIESLRVTMKKVRGGEAQMVEKTLNKVYQELAKNSSEVLHQKAKAFALMLELINSCEAAYRTHRLKGSHIQKSSSPEAIIYVFTSHPTESRSRKFLDLMGKVEELLIESLDDTFEVIEERLYYLLKIAVRLSLANNRRPQVKDEMEQIFHTVLSPEILAEQISLNKKNLNVSFRTWVGGDKDGHPKVGSSTMIESFNLSRQKLLEFISSLIKTFEEEVSLIDEGKIISKDLINFKQRLRDLKVVRASDGKKIVALKKALKKLHSTVEKEAVLSPMLGDIEKLIWFYPALVLPLEIREDSELITKALTDKSQPIMKMLATLKTISNGMDAKWYVRGFVISMCQTSEDMLAAITITKRQLGTLAIPVVPLFENEKGLLNAETIL
jgi:phosphoenolpyruvate carboxylase